MENPEFKEVFNMEETELQRYERLCKEAGITTIIMNFIVRPEQLYKFFRVVVKDCESITPRRTVEVLSNKKYHVVFLEEEVEEEVVEKPVRKPIFVDSNMVVDETPVWKEEPKKKLISRNIKEDVYNIINENDGLLTTRKVGELSEIALRTAQQHTKTLHDEKRIRKEGDFWVVL